MTEGLIETNKIIFLNCDDIFTTSERQILEENDVIFLNDSEAEELYKMYEFSDMVQRPKQSKQYPGLANYVATGLLTREEMIKALIYQ